VPEDVISCFLNDPSENETGLTIDEMCEPMCLGGHPSLCTKAAEATAQDYLPNVDHFPQHFLYFLPLPQGQGSFLPTLAWLRLIGC
jgi:hypothetical protein